MFLIVIRQAQCATSRGGSTLDSRCAFAQCPAAEARLKVTQHAEPHPLVASLRRGAPLANQHIRAESGSAVSLSEENRSDTRGTRRRRPGCPGRGGDRPGAGLRPG
ncbi:hypothetical protein GCM10010279_61070 [Streptomyces mutabilis]|nr:hypothetical protein GCM10010279_61070 [Streptomyces mutabilis]